MSWYIVDTKQRNAPDPDATLYLTAIGDVPTFAQSAWDARVKAFKANNTWSSVLSVLPFLPTQSMTEVLRDGKTNTTVAGFFSGIAEPSPYITSHATGGAEGIVFNALSTSLGTGYIKTGIIPSSVLTLNSTCIAIGTPRDDAGHAVYNFGAFQSATQSLIFNKRDGSNQLIADMYGTTSGSGRALQAGASGGKGVYIINRQSATNMKVLKNGVTVATSTGSQGSLPSTEIWLNRYNAAASSRNQPISFFCVYTTGLTDAQVAQENADWTTFINSMERNVTYTRNVVVDGNSHTVYWRSEFFRQLQYVNAGHGLNAKYHNIGISGQVTTSMTTNGAANADVLYDASCAKNICIAWEITNDISAGTAQATAYSNYVTYCQARRAAGFKVIAMPPMARDYSGDTTKILATDYCVTQIAANWSTFADAYVPHPNANYFVPRSSYASDAAYVTAIQALTDNTTYYSDGATHLTQFGYREWGTAMAAAISLL